MYVSVVASTPICRSSLIEIIFLILNYNCHCYLWDLSGTETIWNSVTKETVDKYIETMALRVQLLSRPKEATLYFHQLKSVPKKAKERQVYLLSTICT